MGPGPPLSYKLKLIAQRKTGRSEIGPSLPGPNTPLSLSGRRIYIYIYMYIHVNMQACLFGRSQPLTALLEAPTFLRRSPMSTKSYGP